MVTDPARAQQEEARLWHAADKIAAAMYAKEVTPYHLLLALMADVHSRWAELIKTCGGTTYGQAKAERDGFARVNGDPHRLKLPSAEDLYGRSDAGAQRRRPLWRRARHWAQLAYQELKAAIWRA